MKIKTTLNVLTALGVLIILLPSSGYAQQTTFICRQSLIVGATSSDQLENALGIPNPNPTPCTLAVRYNYTNGVSGYTDRVYSCKPDVTTANPNYAECTVPYTAPPQRCQTVNGVTTCGYAVPRTDSVPESMLTDTMKQMGCANIPGFPFYSSNNYGIIVYQKAVCPAGQAKSSVITGITASASSSYDNYYYVPAKALDGDQNTYWVGAQGQGVYTYTMNLGKSYKLDTLKMDWYQSYEASNFDVEISTDGVNFTPVVVGLNKASNAQLSGTASYVRLNIKSITNPGYYPILREISVSGW